MIKINCPNIENVKNEYVERIWSSILKNKEKSPLIQETEFTKKCKDLYALSLADITKEKHDEYVLFFNDYDKAETDSFFDYDSIIKYKKDKIEHAYWLTKKLNITVCPYCNRQYVFTVRSKNKEKVTRPQLDHFLNKSNYPFFALSFYNLIPSCSICNHIKGTGTIGIHPHKEGFDDCKFEIKKLHKCIFGSETTNWKIDFSNHSKHFDKNIDVFHLKELYNCHKDYASEMVFKAQAYTQGYYETLTETFSNLGLQESEINLMLYGNYTTKKDFGKRPLAKLTHDILEQLGVHI